MTMDLILIACSIWLFFALASGALARLKNMDGWFWFLRGLLLGGFAFLYLLLKIEE
jgi:hypothetical protein